MRARAGLVVRPTSRVAVEGVVAVPDLRAAPAYARIGKRPVFGAAIVEGGIAYPQ